MIKLVLFTTNNGACITSPLPVGTLVESSSIVGGIGIIDCCDVNGLGEVWGGVGCCCSFGTLPVEAIYRLQK